MQIWTNGMVDLRNRNQQQVAELQEGESAGHDDLEWYGVDWHAPSPTDNGLTTVTVEDLNSPFTQNELQRLSEFDPLSASNNFGIDIYVNAIGAVT